MIVHKDLRKQETVYAEIDHKREQILLTVCLDVDFAGIPKFNKKYVVKAEQFLSEEDAQRTIQAKIEEARAEYLEPKTNSDLAQGILQKISLGLLAEQLKR